MAGDKRERDGGWRVSGIQPGGASRGGDITASDSHLRQARGQGVVLHWRKYRRDGGISGREREMHCGCLRKKEKKSEWKRKRKRREQGQHEVSVEGLGGTRWETHAAKRIEKFQREWVESDDDPLTPDGVMTLFLSPSSFCHPQANPSDVISRLVRFTSAASPPWHPGHLSPRKVFTEPPQSGVTPQECCV